MKLVERAMHYLFFNGNIKYVNIVDGPFASPNAENLIMRHQFLIKDLFDAFKKGSGKNLRVYSLQSR